MADYLHIRMMLALESSLRQNCSSLIGGNLAGSWARTRVTVPLPSRKRLDELTETRRHASELKCLKRGSSP